MTWTMVDRAAGTVTLPDSKNSDSRVLPLEGELGEIIKRRESVRVFTRGDQVIVSHMVFYRDGKQGIRRVGDFRKAWATACKEAGLAAKPLFHDLRRSAVRNMINAEVHELRAIAITGQRTRSVFDRYSIVSLDDMRAALARAQESLR